jgi:hypothetical protein
MKKCKYCGKENNLVISERKNKGTSEEKIIYKNICYDCSNKRKLKGKCRYCGVTENLMTRFVMNQYLKEPKLIIQDVCRKCFGDLTRKHTIGKIHSDETKNNISISVKKWHQSEEGKRKHKESQKNKKFSLEGKEILRQKAILQWKDPEFRIKKSLLSKEQWNDSNFRELMSNNISKRLVEYWKNSDYKEKMIKVSKETWSNFEFKEKMSILHKNRLRDNNPFDNNGFIKISKPEQKLFDLVKILFPSAEQNKSIKTKESRRFPDILIEDYKLIFEYDGSYWHKSEKDDKRNKELQDVGYKIIHYIDRIPDMKELFNDADKILNR